MSSESRISHLLPLLYMLIIRSSFGMARQVECAFGRGANVFFKDFTDFQERSREACSRLECDSRVMTNRPVSAKLKCYVISLSSYFRFRNTAGYLDKPCQRSLGCILQTSNSGGSLRPRRKVMSVESADSQQLSFLFCFKKIFRFQGLLS